MADSWLIVGLGNPGERYARTRHNAGFWFLDELDRRQRIDFRPNRRFHGESSKQSWSGQPVIFLRPGTYMNDSGRAVRAALEYYGVKSDRVVVAYDDLDLPVGAARLRCGGGHGGHNGLRSIFAHVPDHGFWRFRLGIGHPGEREAVLGWVLGRPAVDDRLAIEGAIGRAADVIGDLLDGRAEAAMQALHSTGKGTAGGAGADRSDTR